MPAHNYSWMKGGFFLLLAGLFATQGSYSLPFWNLSAGILTLIGVSYAVSSLVPKEHYRSELIPLKRLVRRD
ncbi:hypothetical protein [Acidithiobacillus sp. AMEEHan]|uniref:hypothetical protein n=1 Tax=Acidithiobacillus sp. AMEEHan TaxID=2994951 RepID=UPI0027E5A594|nr:hypothetical protein [Acidithiobacillus sp. AMEEHan]